MLQDIAKALQISEVDLFLPENDGDQVLINLMQDFARLAPEDQQAVARHARGLLPKGDN